MSSNSVHIAAFYHFADLDNYFDMRDVLLDYCNTSGIKGTILLASEGINSTLSGTKEAVDGFFKLLDQDQRLKGISPRMTFANYQPFSKMKVRLKKEIVALGAGDVDMNNRGKHVAPDEWDDLISDPDVLLIDNRNIYEIKMGTFRGAIDPNNNSFREFPEWMKNWASDKPEHQKVAMYCTGGVRCEKSTAFVKQKLGLENVYHLEGGIINYLQKTNNKNRLWQGDCFIFDDRVALSDELVRSQNIKCILCGGNVTDDELKSVTRGKVICSNCT